MLSDKWCKSNWSLCSMSYKHLLSHGYDKYKTTTTPWCPLDFHSLKTDIFNCLSMTSIFKKKIDVRMIHTLRHKTQDFIYESTLDLPLLITAKLSHSVDCCKIYFTCSYCAGPETCVAAVVLGCQQNIWRRYLLRNIRRVCRPWILFLTIDRLKTIMNKNLFFDFLLYIVLYI